MGIVLGLAAALSFGTADFLVRFAARRVGAYRTLLFMQVVGLVGLSTYLLLSGELVRIGEQTPWQPWGWAGLAALLGTGSGLALYRAYEVGVLALAAPIASSYAALTVLLALLSGETISLAHGLGLGAALIGVALAAAALSPAETEPVVERRWRRFHRLPPGVGWAFVAAAGFGFTFWLLGFEVIPDLGGVVPVWVSRLVSVATLPLFAKPLRQSLRLPRGGVWGWIVAIGVLDTVAYVAAALGLDSDQVAVVSVLVSLFSAVTVLLAWLFLRERLRAHQWFGVALIFAGIALVSWW